MPSIRFVEYDGTLRVVDVPGGQSVMQAAVSSGIRGIEAQCGGSCACATCHVYVDESWVPILGPAMGTENDLLEFVSERRENSRLACQVSISDKLDGLTVCIPKSQS